MLAPNVNWHVHAHLKSVLMHVQAQAGARSLWLFGMQLVAGQGHEL